jgi:hypothetical protein
MAKVKVRVLYPTGFEGLGIDTEGKDEVSVEKADADNLIAAGFAEPVKATKE